MKQWYILDGKRHTPNVLCLDRVLYEMEMWCILFVFVISFSNENRLLHYLRRSITTHTQNNSEPHAIWLLATPKQLVWLRISRKRTREWNLIEWNVLTTEIISTCPASCQKLYTLEMLTRSKGTRTEWSKKNEQILR